MKERESDFSHYSECQKIVGKGRLMVSGNADSVQVSLVKPSHFYYTLTLTMVALRCEVVEHQHRR